MKQPEWTPGSFLDNFNAAALKLGYAHMPIAWGLAKVPWKSIDDRDQFLNLLTKVEGA